MELFIEKLDQLIALKRNKGHKITKKESEEFVSAWSELVAADGGFSERAEQYFYDGFIFAGAKPFVQWVLSQEDSYSALDALFKGRIFGKEAASSFRILISTLAQLIIGNSTEVNLVCPLIKRIPPFSKNKDKKTIGDGHRIVLKYFIAELNNSCSLPSLSVLNIKPAFIRSFVEVFDELLARIDISSVSPKDIQTINAVKIWLHPDTVSGGPAENNSAQDPNENKDKRESTPEFSDQQKRNPVQQIIDPFDQLVSTLSEALNLSTDLRATSKNAERKCATLQESIRSLQREIQSLNTQLSAEKQREAAMEAQLSDKSSQIASLNVRIKSLEDSIQKMLSRIEAKDQEIAQRTQMIDALSRDRTKQSDEQMHRLASKLKVEYRDFRDAEGLSMDCDLGENMREQLRNVFSILIKAGIMLD